MGKAAAALLSTATLFLTTTTSITSISTHAFVPAASYPRRGSFGSNDNGNDNKSNNNKNSRRRRHRNTRRDMMDLDLDLDIEESDEAELEEEEESEDWNHRSSRSRTDYLLELLDLEKYSYYQSVDVESSISSSSSSSRGMNHQFNDLKNENGDDCDDGSAAVIITDDFEIHSHSHSSLNRSSSAGIESSEDIHVQENTHVVQMASLSSPIAFVPANRRRFHSSPSLSTANGITGMSTRSRSTIMPMKNHHHHRGRMSSTLLQYADESNTVHVSTDTSTMMRGLWAMCRPNNFGFVLILHLLGVWQVADSNFLSTIVSSTTSLWPVMLALVLSSCASMVINDIHDAISGVDSFNSRNFNICNKPLVSGVVTQHQARQFLNALYAVISVVVFTGVKGVVGKMFFFLNAIITSIYTPHIKPVTWMKNSVCAMLVAGIPVCSATTALAVQNRSYLNLLKVAPLSAALYLQIFAREMVMDLKDYEGDKTAQIQTVPVKYGRKFASQVSSKAVVVMAVISILFQVFLRNGMYTAGFVAKTFLAAVGSVSMLTKMNEVKVVEGSDYSKNMAFIDNNVGMMMVLASFL